MKISCIALNSNLMSLNEQTSIINFIKTKLYEIGECVSSISYFDNSLEKLKSQNIDSNDVLFVIGTNSSIYNNNIKENLSRIFNDRLERNDACYSALNKYCADNNIVFSMQEEMEILMPARSIPLCDSNYYNNGFMYKFNNTYVAFLPSVLEFAKLCYNNYVLSLLQEINQSDKQVVVLKCFGILEKDIKMLIQDAFNDSNISIQISGDDLDTSIYIRYLNTIDKDYVQNIISDICNKLSKYIYSTEDTSIYQMACDLLSIRGKHLVIGETITYGHINRNLSEIDSSVINDGYIFNNYESIIKLLGIEKRVLDKFGHYSVNTVYELANLMLEKSKAQIALFLLGDKNNDICYMAIGDINGIHVYKNKINYQNENMINNLSKTAMFYLIKKLKQNDLLM